MKEETKDLINLGVIGYLLIKGISLIIICFYYVFKFIKYIEYNYFLAVSTVLLILAIVGLIMVLHSLTCISNYKLDKRIKKLENKRN